MRRQTFRLFLILALLSGRFGSAQATQHQSSRPVPINPQDEASLDSPFARTIFPPGKVKADQFPGYIRLDWSKIPLERIKGYVIYEKVAGEWKRAAFDVMPPFTLKDKDTSGNTEREFSVATLDQSGTESGKSRVVKAQPRLVNDGTPIQCPPKQ